jgi:hypothetical protein
MKLARALVIASFASLVSASAFAQAPSADARARAKEAYDRGVEAHGKGDMQRAAQEFARADALAPTPVALQAALDAAIEADDPVLGSELLERSTRAKPTGALAASVSAARARFAGRAGRVRVQCPSGSTCMATLDGASLETQKPVWAPTGQHTVVVQVDGDAQTKLVRVEPEGIADVAGTKTGAASPSPAPANDEPKGGGRGLRDGLPPIVFYAGVGVTVLLAGATTYFAIDTKNKHDEFDNLGCARANLSDCEDLKDQGQSSQTTTNVGLVLTGVAGVATAVIGAAFTNWKGPMIAAAPLPGGGSVAFTRTF